MARMLVAAGAVSCFAMLSRTAGEGGGEVELPNRIGLSPCSLAGGGLDTAPRSLDGGDGFSVAILRTGPVVDGVGPIRALVL
jgi:hypothetical protein